MIQLSYSQQTCVATNAGFLFENPLQTKIWQLYLEALAYVVAWSIYVDPENL